MLSRVGHLGKAWGHGMGSLHVVCVHVLVGSYQEFLPCPHPCPKVIRDPLAVSMASAAQTPTKTHTAMGRTLPFVPFLLPSHLAPSPAM